MMRQTRTDPVSCVLCAPIGRVQTFAALSIGVLLLSGIAIAWSFEYAGYIPCALCLTQRQPYYWGMGCAAVIVLMAMRAAPPVLVRGLLLLLGLLMLWACGLGIYHAGIEWGLWAGPPGCAGAGSAPQDAGSLMQQLQSAQLVPCDRAAGRFLGLSFAGWNVALTAPLAGLAFLAALRRRPLMRFISAQ